MLFFCGIYIAPTAVDRNLTFLLRYPRWMLKITKRYMSKNSNILLVFFIIFGLNNLSLVSAILSGLLIILPPFVAFFTGFNIGVMSYEMMGWRGIWQILVNPVAWLEFPAAFFSFSFAHQLAEAQLMFRDWGYTSSVLTKLGFLYFKYLFFILLAAAVLEAILIYHSRKLPDDE
jgi:uncharacterized membrane protein SpoIIM required for sporulation